MSDKDLEMLTKLLDDLIKEAPCKGGACVGHMLCAFGENECYGERCAIEDVKDALYTVRMKLEEQLMKGETP